MDGGGLWELGVGGADTDEGGEEREKKKKEGCSVRVRRGRRRKSISDFLLLVVIPSFSFHFKCILCASRQTDRPPLSPPFPAPCLSVFRNSWHMRWGDTREEKTIHQNTYKFLRFLDRLLFKRWIKAGQKKVEKE